LSEIQAHNVVSPSLLFDLDMLRTAYTRFSQCFHYADVYYAVKANPHTYVLQELAAMGACFDVASVGEIKKCCELGISPSRLSFGHTVKKAYDIAFAWQQGIRIFAYDCIEELEKIAKYAPGSKVICRLATTCSNAAWPLDHKFGCSIEKADKLIACVLGMGLVPYGISFHVGSQANTPYAWEKMIDSASFLWKRCTSLGIHLECLNIGGGFPVGYSGEEVDLSTYSSYIYDKLKRCFPQRNFPAIMAEPGRALVADAGVIDTEVILVTRDSTNPDMKWVYIDAGIFNGLMESLGEAIRFRIIPPENRTGEKKACILAGPSCDSIDVMYRKNPCMLPDDVQSGDVLRILSCGAYCATYASVDFNGFRSIQTEFIDTGKL